MESVKSLQEVKKCPVQYVVAINDALNAISGKWKMPIIATLLFEKKRFKDLQENIGKITPRMLSKELKELELNGIVTRTVYDTIPVRVEYQLTESGRALHQLMDVMIEWGLEHRAKVMQ